MLFAKKLLILIGDVVALYLALFLTLFIRYPGGEFGMRLNDHVVPFSLVFIVWILIFFLMNLYRPHAFRDRAVFSGALLNAVLAALIVSTIIFYLFGGFFELTPKTNLLIFSVAFFAVGATLRYASFYLLESTAASVVVLGEKPSVKEVVGFLEKNPRVGYKIVDWKRSLDEQSLMDAWRLTEKTNVDFLVIAEPRPARELVSMLAQKFLPKEIGIISFVDFYENVLEKIPLEELEEGWFIENITTRRPFYDGAKRALDFMLALVFAAVLLPPALLIAVLIALTSRGPVIFAQERVGKNGKIFKLYKFRTMRGVDGGPLWTEKNDPRLTLVGKALRFMHLDEIPQLMNILKGDISFTGPRPERVELAEKYRELPYYDMRHVVKPGLTGWAQINYRPSASLEEAYEKLRYDIYYVKRRSFDLDLAIIIKTARYVFSRHAS